MRKAEDTILFGKYQVCQILGSGQSGTVYKARHVMLDEYRAIKKIPVKQKQKGDPEREARILKGLRHPGIPIIYDVYRTDEGFFLVEEYLEGESLFALVSRRGSLSKAETVSYGIQLCQIISYLHHSADNPILHLDLQPKNILLCQDVLKLIDFDQAVFMSSGHLLERRCGTVGCAAPEQYKREPLSEQTDIYAIGALLFYMRKGVFPRAGESFEGEAGGLAAIIEKCLRERKEERCESVQILLKDLMSLKEESFSNQIQSSLIIAFAGSKSGIGATHVSLGLAVFLADRGIPVLYEEKNKSGAVWQIADDAGVRPDGRGVLHVRRWHLLPMYGPLVRLPSAQEGGSGRVVIRDYGKQWETAAQDPEADAMCLVCGAKPWEWAQTEAALDGSAFGRITVLAVNHLGPGSTAKAMPARLRKKLRDISPACGIFHIPFFASAESLTGEAEAFYSSLYTALAGKEAGACGFWGRLLRKICPAPGRGRRG